MNDLAEGLGRTSLSSSDTSTTRADTSAMTQTPAQIAAKRDRAASMFVVYAESGQTVVCYSAGLAAELAHRTNGSWAKVAR